VDHQILGDTVRRVPVDRRAESLGLDPDHVVVSDDILDGLDRWVEPFDVADLQHEVGLSGLCDEFLPDSTVLDERFLDENVGSRVEGLCSEVVMVSRGHGNRDRISPFEQFVGGEHVGSVVVSDLACGRFVRVSDPDQ